MHGGTYWAIQDFPDASRLDGRVLEMLEPGRQRLVDALDRRPFDGTTADLLRLVDAEMGEIDTPLQELRRARWTTKVETLATRLSPGDAVIDCGSGYGTEAMAFALRGATVTAADLFPTFLRLLEHRVAMYSEVLGIGLADRITTQQAHLAEFEPDRTYEFLWSNESIEHIAPLDDFLQRLPSWLRPRGTAVICNDNALNPIRMTLVARARGSWRSPMRDMTNPATGEPILYGGEAIQTPTSVVRRLRDAGFGDVQVEFHNVVPSVAVRGQRSRRLADALERAARLPGVRYVAAGDYVILAKR